MAEDRTDVDQDVSPDSDKSIEFSPDHLEVLLATAMAGRFEVVYGKMLAYSKEGIGAIEVGQYPPPTVSGDSRRQST
jgi:hypothetical protein